MNFRLKNLRSYPQLNPTKSPLHQNTALENKPEKVNKTSCFPKQRILKEINFQDIQKIYTDI